MNRKQFIQSISQTFTRHQESIATMIVAFPGVVTDAIAEYMEYGYSPYFIRDIFYLSVMAFCFLLFKFQIIQRKDVFKIPVYTVVLGQMISVLFRIQHPEFHFESYFLKAELIFALMMYGIGSLVHIKHIVILLIANTLFIICCYFMVPHFPTSKLVFYMVLVSTSSLMVYFSQGFLLQLYRKLKAANQIIQVKNEELSSMNQDKDRLFRIIGHDLRTPFYQVKTLTELLDTTDDIQEQNELKEILKDSANKGTELLEDLLKWSSSYKANTDVKLEVYFPKQIVDKVIEYLNLKLRSKDIYITNAISENVKVLLNERMMETVFRNLLSNAIKFSHRNATITVQCQEIKNTIVISIVDTGIGMRKKQLNDLFKTQKNTSTIGTENEKGTGFGLGIAKELVEKQGGTLKISSTYKVGTKITMIFPKVK